MTNQTIDVGQAADPAAMLTYTLTALGRVSAGRRGAVGQGGMVGNSRPIHEVLPGSVLRGALAAVWLAGDAPPGADAASFRALFETDMLLRQAVPIGMTLHAMSQRQCKYPDTGCPSAWHDLAVDGPIMHCAVCGGALDEGKGWSWNDIPPTVALTRTALTKDETARDEQLFTRRALRKATILRGSIVVLDAAAHQSEIDWLTRTRELRVGGQRSHMGRMRWECALEAPVSQPTTASKTPGEGERVVLRALSPLIVTDEYGAPSTDIGPTLRLRWPGASVERSWVRPVRLSGWHSASGIAKPEDLACEAGSTFVVEGLPPEAKEQLALGLGLRRLEGYGELQVGVSSGPQARAEATSPVARPVGKDGPSVVTPAPAAPEAPEPDDADPVARLFAVVPEAEAAALVSKVRDAVALLAMRQSAGFPNSTLLGPRLEILQLPWARALGAEARSRLTELLASDDLSLAKQRLETWKGGPR